MSERASSKNGNAVVRGLGTFTNRSRLIAVQACLARPYCLPFESAPLAPTPTGFGEIFAADGE
jgi:hypothetical protein